MAIPISTYRLQFRNGMTFDRAVELVPYWKRLGISHLYASPVFTATNGSTHGYDVIDANAIDPSLGGRAGFDRLSHALKDQGLGLILDIVPNHMAASLENAWWHSVVERGADSPFGRHFDIDWGRKLTLPILGCPLEDALQSDDLTLALDPAAGSVAFCYFDQLIPLNPSTYAIALATAEGPVANAILAAAATVPAGVDCDFHARMRASLADPVASRPVQRHLSAFSRDAAMMQQLHAAQSFRLMSWKDAPRELSYRRFFEVTGLVGLRMEDDTVFNDTHRLILELVANGQVDGLRVDHVDGLSDPAAYLKRLRRLAGSSTYITVEKILGAEEQLPDDWAVSGTTGYEFISDLGNLFVDDTALAPLTRAFGDLQGQTDVAAEMRKAKALMVDENFAGEFATLARLAHDLSNAQASRCSAEAIASGVRAVLLAFPVYRTYGTADGIGASDMALLERVVEKARGTIPAAHGDALSFVHAVLRGDVSSGNVEKAAIFRRRFQQLTGPLMAKSLEDTLFYRHTPLLAVNEVGAEPEQERYSLDRFHDAMARRSAGWNEALSTTATHDTKRGEDARARLYAISEMPGVWIEAVARWRGMNAPFVTHLPEGPAPEPAVEWMLLQSLAGAWEPTCEAGDAATLSGLSERLRPYAEKAMREAKLRTNWTDVNTPYEKAVTRYVEKMLSAGNREFLEDFIRTLQPLLQAGLTNGLAQTLVKLTAPGIPDIYQGSERADFSLVDPDNRREPDFAVLSACLDAAHSLAYSDTALRDGSLKQALIARCLAVRRETEALFRHGDYVRLAVAGPLSGHVVAFARQYRDDTAVVLAPRLLLGLQPDGRAAGIPWKGTSVALPQNAGQMRNALTDRPIAAGTDLPLETVFDTLPVALLVNR